MSTTDSENATTDHCPVTERYVRAVICKTVEITVVVPLHTDFTTCSSIASFLHYRYLKVFNSSAFPCAAVYPAVKGTTPMWMGGSAISGIQFHWKVSLMKARSGFYPLYLSHSRY